MTTSKWTEISNTRRADGILSEYALKELEGDINLGMVAVNYVFCDCISCCTGWTVTSVNEESNLMRVTMKSEWGDKATVAYSNEGDNDDV
jgi:hypothetical protein